MAEGGRQDWDVMPTPNDELMVIFKANEKHLKGMNDFMTDIVRKNLFFLIVMVDRVDVCVIVDNLLNK